MKDINGPEGEHVGSDGLTNLERGMLADKYWREAATFEPQDIAVAYALRASIRWNSYGPFELGPEFKGDT